MIELVVAMTITAIIVGFVTMFMTAPVDAYMSQSERAVLNDSTEVITRRMAADLKSALPNSVRITNSGTRAIVEMVLVNAAAVYRPAFTPADTARELDINSLETQFPVFGTLSPQLPPLAPPFKTGRLVIGNSGAGVTNIYQPPAGSFITTAGLDIQVKARSASGEETVSIPSPGFRFSSADSQTRIFTINGPVTYICNSAAGSRSLRRYAGYATTPAIPASEAAANLNAPGVENLLLANNVASCQLSCAAAGSPCQRMLVVEFSVSRQTTSGDEFVRIFEQFPVDNT